MPPDLPEGSLWADEFRHAFVVALHPMDQAAAIIEVSASFLILYSATRLFDWIARRKRSRLALPETNGFAANANDAHR